MRCIAIFSIIILLGILIGRKLCRARRRPAQTAPEAFADPDSRFVAVNGVRIHYKSTGQGEPVLLLLHGSFLSLYSWREVLPALGRVATVIAFDRPAFGLTARPIPATTRTHPYSPEDQADLAIALLDQLRVSRAILVGNSTGGTIALLAALRHPSRVQALVLADAMVYSGYAVSEIPAWVRPALPVLRPLGVLLLRTVVSRALNTLIRSLWYDRSRVTPGILARYRVILQMENWDRALWELTCASHALDLETQLARVRVPVLVITGDQDRAVHTAESVRLADALPNTELVVIPNCGHLPQEECPERFVQAVTDFIARIAQVMR